MIETLNKVKVIKENGLFSKKVILKPIKCAIIQDYNYISDKSYKYYFIQNEFSLLKKEFESIREKVDNNIYILPFNGRYTNIKVNDSINLYNNIFLSEYSLIMRTVSLFVDLYDRNIMAQHLLDNIDKNMFHNIIDDSEIAYLYIQHAGKKSSTEDMLIDYINSFYEDLHKRKEILDIKNMLNDGLSNKIFYVNILNDISNEDDIKRIVKSLSDSIENSNISDKDRYELIKVFKNIVNKYNNKLISSNISSPDF